MDLQSALLIFATHYIDKTNHNMAYDKDVMGEVVTAIASITTDPSEAETLLKISRWESGGFRRDIATCKVKGDHGQALGLWQVHPRNKDETKAMCASIREQAVVALNRIHESVAWCGSKNLKGSDLLTGYTRGTCNKNDKFARLRWGDGKQVTKIMLEN
jgi:hypothetical protein